MLKVWLVDVTNWFKLTVSRWDEELHGVENLHTEELLITGRFNEVQGWNKIKQDVIVYDLTEIENYCWIEILGIWF